MPKNDEGEFELVLGNKQLLSVFFIVVVLLGVFFTMGYIVGRNTGVEAAAQMAAEPGQPLVVESERASTTTRTPPTQTGTAQPPPPARTAPPERSAPPPAAAPPRRPQQTRRPAPPKARPPAPAPARASGQPAPGQTFLQVAATTQPEAEVLRDLLAKRGFRTRIAPVPGQNLFRVLVGPVSGEPELAQNRSKLIAAGFKPFTRRYK